jgi:hypothetical protein
MHGKTLITALLATAPLLMTAAAVAADADAPELNQAQQLVFMDDHLSDIPRNRVLSYKFESHIKGMEDVADTVRMTVTEVREDNSRNLSFDFLSGNRHIDFHDAEGYRGNPVIIQFLERDIRDMSLATGGSSDYFRNRIRKSFAEPQIRTLRISLDGKDLEAVEVMVTPFVNDPNIDKFQRYSQKRYEFIFAEQVPGGLYRIHTLVPSDDTIEIEEQLTFSRVTDAG